MKKKLLAFQNNFPPICINKFPLSWHVKKSLFDGCRSFRCHICVSSLLQECDSVSLSVALGPYHLQSKLWPTIWFRFSVKYFSLHVVNMFQTKNENCPDLLQKKSYNSWWQTYQSFNLKSKIYSTVVHEFSFKPVTGYFKSIYWHNFDSMFFLSWTSYRISVCVGVYGCVCRSTNETDTCLYVL